MKKLIGIFILLFAFMGVANAQPVGKLQAGQVWGNSTASPATATGVLVGPLIDQGYSCTGQGSILMRGASAWTCLIPGTSGKALVSAGAGANLAYTTLGIVGGGTNCAAASATCLDNITGFSSTGFMNRTGAGAYSFIGSTGTGNVVLQTSPALTSPTATSVAVGGATLGSNASAINGTETITSNSSQAFSVGPNGQTNPSFSVNASTASAVTGVQIAGSSVGGGAAVLTLSSATNETLNINAKGSGVISLGGASTGNVIAGIGGGQLVSTNDFVATTGILRSANTFQLINAGSAQGIMVNCLLVSATYTTCPAAGVVNVGTGFQIGGAAASANYLRGNGTNFVAAPQATLAAYTAGTGGGPIEPSTIYTAETTTTFGATTTFDFSTFINTAVTLTANITTMSVANVKAGQAGTITFIQDATGSRTTVWNSVFKFPSGAQPTLSTTANAVDILTYSCRSATFCAASLLKQVQ